MVVADFDFYLVIDFEASGWVRDSREWEIVEFPIVIVDSRSQQILPHEFHRFVKPTTVPQLSEVCMKNCGITQADVDQALPIAAVVDQVDKWVSNLRLPGTFVVVTCGDYDLGTALPAEAIRKEFVIPTWLQTWVNIKVPFAQRYGHTVGMKGMLKELRLSLDGHHHSGIDDARNIAKLVVSFLKLGHALSATGCGDGPNRRVLNSSGVLRQHMPHSSEAPIHTLARKDLAVSGAADAVESTRGLVSKCEPPRRGRWRQHNCID